MIDLTALETFLKVSIGSAIYIGIDPGVTGAIGFLAARRCLVLDIPVFQVETGRRTKKGKAAKDSQYNYPDINQIFRALDDVASTINVIIEKGQTMGLAGLKFSKKCPVCKKPFKGADTPKTAYQVGWASGMWPLFFTTLGIPVTWVAPLTWKRALGLTGKDKEFSRSRAQQLFPSADLARKKDHNRAEALLLASYLRTQLTTSPS